MSIEREDNRERKGHQRRQTAHAGRITEHRIAAKRDARTSYSHVAESHKNIGMAGDIFNFEEAWARNQQPATGRRAEAHRLATAMRRVIDHLVQVAAPEESLRAAADALEKYAERLSQYPVSRAYEGFAETANAGDTNAFF